MLKNQSHQINITSFDKNADMMQLARNSSYPPSLPMISCKLIELSDNIKDCFLLLSAQCHGLMRKLSNAIPVNKYK